MTQIVSLQRVTTTVFTDDFTDSSFKADWTITTSGTSTVTLDTGTYHLASRSVNMHGVDDNLMKITVTKTFGHASIFFKAWLKRESTPTPTYNMTHIMNGAGTNVYTYTGIAAMDWTYEGAVIGSLTPDAAYNYYISFQHTGTDVSVHPSAWVDEVAIGDAVITFNGLLDGQKVKFYKSSVLINTSAASVGGVLEYTLVTADVDDLPFDRIDITDTDGTTVIYTTSIYSDIYGGDVFQIQVTQTPLTNPPPIIPLKVTRTRLTAYTSKRIYKDIMYAEISPSAANVSGMFRLILSDKSMITEKDVGDFDINDYERLWITGKVGPKKEKIIYSIIERTMPVRLRGGQWGIEIAGRDFSKFADDRRASTTTEYTNEDPADIVRAFASEVPELEFGNYIYNAGITIPSWTMLRGRSYWDAMKELASFASTPTETWGVWVSNGEYRGETKPNVHFGPVQNECSLIPIVIDRTFRTMAPKDWRQIITRTVVAYDNAGTVDYLTTNAVGPGIDNAYYLDFVGSGVSYGSIAHNALLRIGTGFTIETWINPDTVAGTDPICVKLTDYQFYLNAGIPTFGVYDGVDYAPTAAGTTALTAGTGYLLQAVYDNGTLYVYVNGQRVGSATNTAAGTGTNAFRWGYDGSNFFDGKSANLRVYPYALTAKECMEHYKGVYYRGGEVLKLMCTDGTGTTVTDSSGNGLDMTIGATVAWTANYNIPNGQRKYGAVTRFFDRSWAGLNEATSYARVILRTFRQPTRFVESWVQVDLRFKNGQLVYIRDKSFRGRAILDNVRLIFDEDQRAEVTCVYT